MYLHHLMVVISKSCLSEAALNILNADVGRLSLKSLVVAFNPINLYTRVVKRLLKPHSPHLS